MKHAYLIMAHNNFEQLLILLELLDFPDNVIFIHVDKKSEVPAYISDLVLTYSPIIFTERINVYWGDYSQIDCELTLLQAAFDYPLSFSYYHLISGVDLPLVDQKKFHDFFEINKGKEFVSFIDKKWTEEHRIIKKRIYGYSVFQKYYRSKIKSMNKIFRLIDKISVELQLLFRINRTKMLNEEFMFGPNWFSITNEFTEYILGNRGWIEKVFRYTLCGDEIFLQTLMYNSEFYKKNYGENLRYVDWERGNPYIFKLNDYEELENSSKLFARKFDTTIDCKIIERICESINERKD
ncbi:beta-1,6-N-acetylglucosaminyltransferase [Caryophanon latum]|uniref:Peptide O-xylosyltransferase n=1 Tax=Caryophanon latum TaxID=33977 RepID=A0A1C0YIQ4_9BACL|nr:beta-1,6-N-acetylglucosaminyltransferase [Caryophanon latum]OCS87062.1 hypothetical protein A6K76_14105 [Caryophanon latum]